MQVSPNLMKNGMGVTVPDLQVWWDYPLPQFRCRWNDCNAGLDIKECSQIVEQSKALLAAGIVNISIKACQEVLL